MIKTFCDCCGKEIPDDVNKRFKTVSIEKKFEDEKFFVSLSIDAQVYRPSGIYVPGGIKSGNFIGSNLCNECVIKGLMDNDS